MTKPRDYIIDGERIDGKYQVPVNQICCPGCGKKYTVRKKVCLSCLECQKCCSCGDFSKKIVPVDDEFIYHLLES